MPTVDELKADLDALGVEYHSDDLKADLEVLLATAEAADEDPGPFDEDLAEEAPVEEAPAEEAATVTGVAPGTGVDLSGRIPPK